MNKFFLSTLISCLFLAANASQAQEKKETNQLTIYFNNLLDQSFVSIQTAKCWQNKNTISESSTLNIPKSSTTKIVLGATCLPMKTRNIYKLRLINNSLVAIRDIPEKNKRCLGLQWHNSVYDRYEQHIYCGTINELDQMELQFNFITPEESKVYQIKGNPLAKKPTKIEIKPVHSEGEI
ncbi:hypothetical protein L3V86_07545 [Thiotrichales bacterium 19S11-10]|nr:hypothetical protein [Thiotrichales bacterium 19S11-10]